MLSSMYGASLSNSIEHAHLKFRPAIINTLLATSGPKIASTLEQMLWEVVKYLGRNNVLVGLYVCSALAALQLLVNAERVVDSSDEPKFKTLSYNFTRMAKLPFIILALSAPS